MKRPLRAALAVGVLMATCTPVPKREAPLSIPLSFDQKWLKGTLVRSTAPANPSELTLTLEIADSDEATAALGVPPFGGRILAGETIQCVEVRLFAEAESDTVRVLSYPVNDAPPLWSALPVWCPHVGSRWVLTFTIGTVQELERSGVFPNRLHVGDEWVRTHANRLAVVLTRLPRRNDDLREVPSSILARAVARSAWVQIVQIREENRDSVRNE